MKLEACKKCPYKLKCILLGPQKIECRFYSMALASSYSCNEVARAFRKLSNIKGKV